MGFAQVTSANSGIVFNYGVTMADQRVVLHSWQGSAGYTYLSEVSATSFTIRKDPASADGWVHFASLESDQ